MKPFRALGVALEWEEEGLPHGEGSLGQDPVCPVHPEQIWWLNVFSCPACSGLGQLLCLFPLQGSVAGVGSRAPKGALAAGNQVLQAAPGQKIRLHVAGRPFEVSAAGQGPGELVRPVPKGRQAVRSPAHSSSLL